MKTERRHELQKNELADWFSHYVEIFQNYWQLILAGLIGLIALVWLVGYLFTPGQKNAKEWREYLAEMWKVPAADDTKDSLAAFGQKNRTTTPGLWALQLSADRHLAEGMQQQFIDRTKSKESFKKAAETYVAVAQEATKDPFLLSRANFGAAQAYEGSGDIKKAIDYYKQAAKADQGKAAGKEAERRLAMLEKKEIGEWYDWFFKHPVQPVAIRRPTPQLPPLKENLAPFHDLPDIPELSLPKVEDLDKPLLTRPTLGPELPPTTPATPTTPVAPPDPKPETKPATPEPKPESKPEPKPETKPEEKPEPKVEAKPETKPEEKPAEKGKEKS